MIQLELTKMEAGVLSDAIRLARVRVEAMPTGEKLGNLRPAAKAAWLVELQNIKDKIDVARFEV